VTLGLAILAAAPTGGSSLAAGAAFAGLALDVYLVWDALDSHQTRRAASNTNIDKARSLSEQDPSLPGSRSSSSPSRSAPPSPSRPSGLGKIGKKISDKEKAASPAGKTGAGRGGLHSSIRRTRTRGYSRNSTSLAC
jgi:hypothetical protein